MPSAGIANRLAALNLTPAAEARIAELMSRAFDAAIGVKLSTPLRGCSGISYHRGVSQGTQ